MEMQEREDTTFYNVVMNHEEQYSIWPADRENPLGWENAGKSGSKEECLDYIAKVWTDMRPLSLRKRMEEAALQSAPPPSPPSQGSSGSPGTANRAGDDLVNRLSEIDHPVELSLKPEATIEALREYVDRGYVHIKFTDTQGGTELGFRLDPESVLSQPGFVNGHGMVHLEGSLTLNYVQVQCVADIDLQSFAGRGKLVPVK